MIENIPNLTRTNDVIISELKTRLSNSIAYKVAAPTPWYFYEVLDALIGFRGNRGYPIFIGKFYCMAFNSNTKLFTNALTASWVRSTTVKMQEKLRDFIIHSLKRNNTNKISEIELRSYAQKAFESVFNEGSLNTIIGVAPEILPILKTMHGKERLSYGYNFRDILANTMMAIETMVPGMLDEFTSGTELPEFQTEIRMVFNRTRHEYAHELKMNRNLYDVSVNLMTGKLDDLNVLNYLVDRLKFNRFTDETTSALAKEIVLKANIRLSHIENYYAPLRTIRPNLDL